MAQQIKHRRGSLNNIGFISPVVEGEIIIGSGSLGSLTGPVTFVGGTGSYAPIAKIYSGSTVPDASSPFNSFLEGLPFYNTTDKALFIVQGMTGSKLDLAGNLNGSIITPASISASGDISASNLWLSGNANISGNITLGGNITIGDQMSDTIQFTGEVSSSILPIYSSSFDLGSSSQTWRHVYADSITVDYGTLTVGNSGSLVVGGTISSSLVPQLNNAFDLGSSGSNWNSLWVNHGHFVTASGYFTGSADLSGSFSGSANLSGSFSGSADLSGSFTGSFSGDGSGLTGLVTTLTIEGDTTTGSIDLLSQSLYVLGTAYEVETSISGNILTIGLPDVVHVSGNLEVGSYINATGNISSSGDIYAVSGSFDGDVTIDRNLYVTGSTYTSLIVGSGSIKLQPTGSDARYLEIYNTSAQDTHITASGGWLFLGDDTTYVKVDNYSTDKVVVINAENGTTVYGNFYHSGSAAEFSGSVTIGGNLTVNGTTSIINSTEIQLGDNIIELNGTGIANGGLRVKDPTAPSSSFSGSLLWDSTYDYWKGGQEGNEKRIGLLSTNPLYPNALIFGNGDSELVSAPAPNLDGDIPMWNGTGSIWTMSNVIDGGTF